LGVGGVGLGLGPQPPIPNPQIPNLFNFKIIYVLIVENNLIFLIPDFHNINFLIRIIFIIKISK
jgi:hypothetical protein